MSDGGGDLPGTVSVSGRRLTFTSDDFLPGTTSFTVDVDGFTDVVGNPVVPFTSGFTTSGLPGRNLSEAAATVASASSFFSASFPAFDPVVACGDMLSLW